MQTLAVLTHIYYESSYAYLRAYFLNLTNFNSSFFFCISNHENNKKLVEQIAKDFPGSYIIAPPNIGKDVGGKIALIDLMIKLNFTADYYILLHDKKSPHSTLGDTWREKLFRIIEPPFIEKIKMIFEENKSIGIIGAKEFIKSEYKESTGDFECTSNSILKELIVNYSLKLDTHEFIGGTMFWVRPEIINTFFLKYPPLEIRKTFEKGNVLDNQTGTQTHAWERMLSWLAIDQGYKIKGI